MFPEPLQLGQIHETLGEVQLIKQGGPQQCITLNLVTNFAAFVPTLTTLVLLSEEVPTQKSMKSVKGFLLIPGDFRPDPQRVSHAHISFPILHATSLSNANNMFLMALNQPNSQCLEEAPSTRSLESF